MKEVEVKILNIDRHRVEESLQRLGAEKVFDAKVSAFFYDFKDGALSKSHSVLRLRQEGDVTMLTFKKILGKQGAKIAEEVSVKVSDLSQMQKILESVGLFLTGTTKKHRTSYQLETAHFDIDSYMGQHNFIPDFMEIEAENLQVIHKWAAILGFQSQACLPWSINDLVKYYSSKNQNEKSKNKTLRS